MLHHINDRSLRLVLRVLRHLLVTNETPDLVDVDCWAYFAMLDHVEVAHTHLTEETWVILVPHDSVVMLATSVATSTWVLPVFSNATMTSVDLAAVPAILLKACCHHLKKLLLNV